MLFRGFERIFVIALLLVSMHVATGLTSPLLSEEDPETISGDLHLSSVAPDIVLAGWGGVLILLRWRHVLRSARRSWRLLVLAALPLLSVTWSIQPSLTFRRSIILLLFTLFAIYLGDRYTIEKLARLTVQAICLMMIAVLIFYAVAPEYVVDQSSHIGAFKGLSTHKNNFGEYMAAAVVLLLLIRFHQFAWCRYLFLAGAVFFLLASRSVGSLICCLVVVAAMPFWAVVRRRGKQWLVVCTLAAVVAFAAIYALGSNSNLVLASLGRNSTLTGRTELWTFVWRAISKRPVLGYGYDIFWTGLKGENLNVLNATDWLAAAADNGYLDLCLSLGLLGLVTFAYVFTHYFSQALDFVRAEPKAIGLWPITYLSLFALHATCESALLTKGTFPFLVFAIVVSSLSAARERLITATPVTMDASPHVAYGTDLLVAR